MSSPSPSEGERPTDPQSETVSRPVPEEAPPRRTRGTPVGITLLMAVWLLLGVALVVVAVLVLF